MKHIFNKLEEIKEKVVLLASKMEVLRSENHAIIEENQKLKSKLHEDAAEIRLLRTQLTIYKAKIDGRILGETLEKEEELGKRFEKK